MTTEHKPHPPPVPGGTHPRADVLAEEYRGRYLWDELDKARERIAGLEAAMQEVEKIAFHQYLDWMHFHELAMAKPFEAESEALDFARRVCSLLTLALGDATTIEVVGDSVPKPDA